MDLRVLSQILWTSVFGSHNDIDCKTIGSTLSEMHCCNAVLGEVQLPISPRSTSACATKALQTLRILPSC